MELLKDRNKALSWAGLTGIPWAGVSSTDGNHGEPGGQQVPALHPGTHGLYPQQNSK